MNKFEQSLPKEIWLMPDDGPGDAVWSEVREDGPDAVKYIKASELETRLKALDWVSVEGATFLDGEYYAITNQQINLIGIASVWNARLQPERDWRVVNDDGIARNTTIAYCRLISPLPYFPTPDEEDNDR